MKKDIQFLCVSCLTRIMDVGTQISLWMRYLMSTKPSDQYKLDLNLWLGLTPINRYFEKPADVDVYTSQSTFLSEIQKYLKRLESALSLPCFKPEVFTWCGVLEEPMSSGKSIDGSHVLSMTMCSM